MQGLFISMYLVTRHSVYIDVAVFNYLEFFVIIRLIVAINLSRKLGVITDFNLLLPGMYSDLS